MRAPRAFFRVVVFPSFEKTIDVSLSRFERHSLVLIVDISLSLSLSLSLLLLLNIAIIIRSTRHNNNNNRAISNAKRTNATCR